MSRDAPLLPNLNHTDQTTRLPYTLQESDHEKIVSTVSRSNAQRLE